MNAIEISDMSFLISRWYVTSFSEQNSGYLITVMLSQVYVNTPVYVVYLLQLFVGVLLYTAVLITVRRRYLWTTFLYDLFYSGVWRFLVIYLRPCNLDFTVGNVLSKR